jgi:hypothetical protein
MVLAPMIDHLVYGAPDLEQGIAAIEARLGVRPSPGGSHPGFGTHNALLSLGPRVYLEVIALEPSQPAPPGPRVFGLDSLTAPRLVTWAAQSSDLERRVASSNGLGPIVPGSRRRPDGRELSWRTAFPKGGPGVIPLLIDWGASVHPASTSPSGGELLGLRVEHPDPERIAANLNALGAGLPVSIAPTAALVATIRTARGDVELR